MKDQGFRALATIVFYEYCSVVSTMTSMCRLQQRKRTRNRHRSLLEGEKSREEMVFTYSVNKHGYFISAIKIRLKSLLNDRRAREDNIDSTQRCSLQINDLREDMKQ